MEERRREMRNGLKGESYCLLLIYDPQWLSQQPPSQDREPSIPYVEGHQ